MKRTRIDIPPDLTFVPVPRRASSGGWNPQRQREFITVLAATGSGAQAVAVVGSSKTGAYLLRNAKGGGDFRRAWDAAIEDGVAVLRSVAFERAVDGVEGELGIATTGVAGPTEQDGHPVGLVYVAVSDARGDEVREHRFVGERAQIRNAAVMAALELAAERLELR